jgi:uncharacterized membrane protein
MDPVTIVAVAMLIGWGAATMFLDAPGWVHLFLTVGVFLLLYRIATRAPAKKEKKTE